MVMITMLRVEKVINALADPSSMESGGRDGNVKMVLFWFHMNNGSMFLNLWNIIKCHQ